MRRQHLLYLFLLPILYLMYSVQSSYSSASAFFYGFAENKETELSHDNDVLVTDIFVTQGESVTEGQVLMSVSRPELVNKEIDSDLQEESNLLKLTAAKKEIEDKQTIIRNDLAAYLAKKQSEREEVNAREQQNKAELKSLKSVVVDLGPISEKTQAQLKRIEQEVASYTNETEIRLQQLESQQQMVSASLQLAKKKVGVTRQQIATAYKQLDILAPADGVIGNIQSKRGENLKAFSTLMTFYESNPTIVKGYVHENFILQVNKGDTLTITSTLRPEHVIKGKVVGLGSRIVEIPERLRKMPTVKTYGREVLVEISSKNSFLQKEKVSINSSAVSSGVLQPQNNTKLEKDLKKELSVK